ncbi:MAG: ABC transporter permease subunit [Brevundimonas sp.]|uniref:ABC transporter permease subunit n=1 Tax=Brevundimonas sp. TaxID=1871086 RepID=UPI0027370A34|nr:ABC transporter permease subunit [Brevundimonas sp.]MDP3406060.1 ABC transporter permease subunit [Brevundimonas sp.]
MLTDAIRAEAYRFSKNRMAVFWSVLFVPLLLLAIGTVVQLVTKARSAEMAKALPPELTAEGGPLATSGPLDLGQSLVSQAAEFANPILLLFVLIGAAIIYAGDYRWETWRLTSARNSRLNLVLGKVVIVLAVVGAALVTSLVFGLISEIIKGVIFARPFTFGFGTEQAGQFGAFVGLMVTRVMQFTMIALLAAALTRSLLAALFVPLAVAIGQFFLMQALPMFGWTPGDLHAQLLIPGMATDSLKGLIAGGADAASAPDGIAWKAALSLILWTVVPLVAAVAWFQRQDLSKE